MGIAQDSLSGKSARRASLMLITYCSKFGRLIAWSAHVNVVWNGRRASRRRSCISLSMSLWSKSSIVVGCSGVSRNTASTLAPVNWLDRTVNDPPDWPNMALCGVIGRTALWPATCCQVTGGIARRPIIVKDELLTIVTTTSF